MDDVHESERLPVYHDPRTDALVAELWPAGPPRLFALVDEDEDENDEVVREVMAYGIALPDGAATTVGATGVGWASWLSADSAFEWMGGSDLIWLSQ